MFRNLLFHHINRCYGRSLRLTTLIATLTLTGSCARMGQPDGGWYDETPPRVIGATPAEGAVGVNAKKIYIYFNEYVTIENPTEKVVVSPPQLEMPEIKGQGKRIMVELKDSLKPNTTYTIDFSDAISDNNESNPLGNFTYTFSTGDAVDTMEVAGYVMEAENLEPVKGMLVGLYDNVSDTAFTSLPMLRVSRTDSRGRFVIRGIAPGNYRVYALQDMDGDYKFSQKAEKIAFSHDIIVPSSKPDVRQDTIWTDSLHIRSIRPVNYTHFLPDDIVLKAFTEVQTDRYFLKAERKEADHFTLFFSAGSDTLPEIRGLNFDGHDAFLLEKSEKNDTLTYWLRDTALVNQDTLRLSMRYLTTDTTGVLVQQTDTLDILSKNPYAKRLKKQEKEREDFMKKVEKALKRGDKVDTVMPREKMKPEVKAPAELDPDRNISFTFPVPLARLDSNAVHLYAKHDSLWYRAPLQIRRRTLRDYELLGEWRPEIEYSLEVDSAAFEDLYGKVNDKFKQGFKVKSLDDYSSLFVTLSGLKSSDAVVQLLDRSDNVVKQAKAEGGQAEIYFIRPDTYYLRLFVDTNGNGVWDTGDYAAGRQAEEVYYFPEAIECRAKWDVSRTWNVNARPFYAQKPGEIVKQKSDKKKTVKNRNAERAKKLGIEYIPPTE